MHLQTPQGSPPWDDGVEHRLFVSMLLAAVFVAGALSLVRMPLVPAWSPVVALMVRIVDDTRVAAPETEAPLPALPALPASPVQTPGEALAEVPRASAPTMGRDVLDENQAGFDWDAARDQAVQDYVDSQDETYGYFDPDLADKRRALSERYQPRTRPLPKAIWENVEKDTMGRTVLRSGNCFKVLDDPNVGSREAFEAFGQHIVQCTFVPYMYKPLPWVGDVRQRHGYLLDPDGYVKGEPDE